MTTGDNSSTSRPRATKELNEIRRVDGGERQAPDRSVPDSIRPHYHQDGNAFRSAHRNDKIEFVDRGHRMHAYRPASTFTVRALAMTAELRGWSAAEISGDKDFKSRAYIELETRGIGVRGYEPTAKDREILQNREDRKAAKENPKVQAFLAATDTKQMEAAAKKYPELKDAFVVRALLHKAAETIASPKGQEMYVASVTDRIALAVHRGEPIKEQMLRQTPSQGKADRSAEQDR